LNESTVIALKAKESLQARDVASRVAGRTFYLSHRNISFAADGKTIAQLVLQGYNSSLKDFQVKKNLSKSAFHTEKEYLKALTILPTECDGI
jgi:hypothetical protein